MKSSGIGANIIDEYEDDDKSEDNQVQATPAAW